MTRMRTALSTAAVFCVSFLNAGAQFQPGATQQDKPSTAARSTQADSGEGLHVVQNPGGGEYVYGTLTGEANVSDAMVYMLKQVHGHFGDKPQIGKFFQSKDGGSIATFFTLTAKNYGSVPVTGMLIVYGKNGGAMSAAVLSDTSKRFATSQPQMMRSLAEAWQKQAQATAGPSNVSLKTGSGANANGSQGVTETRPQPLRRTSGGDNSAFIGLPAGWQLTQVAGGSVKASGPNGEMIGLALMFQGINDPSLPQPATRCRRRRETARRR